MLSEEQAEDIKKQLIEQVEKSFPEDKKSFAISRINSMDSEQLETFLAENNLVTGQKKGNECIFCSIVFGEIPSYKIKENSDSIAVLEINPISKGHSLIIPKAHVTKKENLSEKTLELAKEISKKISSKLKPKNVEIYNSNLFGHEIINILPIYSNENSNSPRLPAKKDDLEHTESLLKIDEKEEKLKKPKKERKSSKTKSSSKKDSEKKAEIPKKLWLPQRIP